MAHALEKEIVEGCKAQKAHYQKRLYKTYYGKMLSICLRYSRNQEEAKDILQEGFIKIFMNISRFKQEGSLEGWIRRIMINTAVNHYHKNKRMYSMSELSQERQTTIHLESNGMVVSEDAISKLEYEALMELVQNLTPAYRLVFNLYVIEGFTHREIAAMLQISEGTSKSNLAKARAKLQKQVVALMEERKETSACLKN
ncbi:MAG: RNA polymerase sigma factor [Thermonemataceae bacterium]